MPWLVYNSMVKTTTTKPFLRDATECSTNAEFLFDLVVFDIFQNRVVSRVVSCSKELVDCCAGSVLRFADTWEWIVVVLDITLELCDATRQRKNARE